MGWNIWLVVAEIEVILATHGHMNVKSSWPIVTRAM